MSIETLWHLCFWPMMIGTVIYQFQAAALFRWLRLLDVGTWEKLGRPAYPPSASQGAALLGFIAGGGYGALESPELVQRARLMRLNMGVILLLTAVLTVLTARALSGAG